MADVQIVEPTPVQPSTTIVERSGSGAGTILAIILAVVIGAALIWYFTAYRPSTVAPVSAPATSGSSINVNVPPVTINTNTSPASPPAPAKPAPAAAP